MPELGWLIEKEVVPKLELIEGHLESIAKSLKILSDHNSPSYVADALESIAESLKVRFPSRQTDPAYLPLREQK